MANPGVIAVTQDGMKAMVIEAMFASIGEVQRAELVKAAIGALITPKQDGYGSHTKKSPLQDAFDQAVHLAAREIAKDKIANDPQVIEQIQSVCVDAMQRVFEKKREQIVEEMAESLISAINIAKRG